MPKHHVTRCRVSVSVADLRREPHPVDPARPKDRLQESQVLWGEAVNVLEEVGEWARVEIPGQPRWSEERGWHPYPGWMLSKALTPSNEQPVMSSWVLEIGGERSWGTRSLDGAQAPPLLEAGLPLLGLPYYWGGRSDRGIDCSGLIHLLFLMHGKVLPRDACDQERACSPVKLSEHLPGDLIFRAESGKTDHVMLALSEGKVLEATEETMRVQVEDLTKLMQERGGVYRAGRCQDFTTVVYETQREPESSCESV